MTVYRATEAELKQYGDLGFFVREKVFSEEEIEGMRAGAESVHAQILEAADLPEAGLIDQVDNQKYQCVLGSTIKWEWQDDLRGDVSSAVELREVAAPGQGS